MLQQIFFRVVSTYQPLVLASTLAIPVFTFVLSFVHGVYDGRRAPWRQVYAFVSHLTTAAFGAAIAFLLLSVIDGQPISGEGVPWFGIGSLFVGWIATLLAVKRAVDFRRMRSVRNPFVLALMWVIAWIASYLLTVFRIIALPVSTEIVMGGTALVIFIVLRVISGLIFRLHSTD